jgi:hypothetical protein
MKTRAIVSEVLRDVVEMQQILKGREDNNGQNKAVSNLSVIGGQRITSIWAQNMTVVLDSQCICRPA